MHVTKVNILRIMLRDRGNASELSIDSELIIQPDDPAADAIRQHNPESVKLDTLSPRLQAAVAELLAACYERVSKQHPISGV